MSLTCFKTVSGDIKPFWSKYKLMWGFFRLTIIIIIIKKNGNENFGNIYFPLDFKYAF